jgi:pimeloyl-ACP methyl ester carboxylesterase
VTHPSDAATGAALEAALEALRAPGAPEHLRIEAAGIPFHALAWGDPAADPLVIMHGVTASAGGWWRIGPALAAAGYRVIAPDLPGHGLTDAWRGHVAPRDNAADMAAFARAAFPGKAPGDVRVVGHSWGGMTAAWFPGVGYAPRVLVLVDPPYVPLALIARLLENPDDRHYDGLAEAMDAVGAQSPTWAYGDVAAKALSLTQFDEPAVLAVLTKNGDWDGGLAALADPAARDVPIRLIRGDPATGGYIPDAALPAFEARLGAENVTTITGAPHSPHRTHPIETTRALLRALAG